MNLASGSKAGGSDDLLFAMLCNVSITKDLGSPIYILLEEENASKWRKDINGFYDAMRATTDKREKKLARLEN